MNPRKLIDFVKSKTGRLFIFFGLVATALSIAIGAKGSKPKPSIVKPAGPGKPQLVETVKGTMVDFQVPIMPETTPTPAPTPAPVPLEKKPVLAPISLYTAPPEPAVEPLSEDYAPYGRLLQCELIVTVDSSAIETPVIGLITADVWHDQRLIIPAGTEVHGKASLNRARERIAAEGRWTLVWQTGEELIVSGVALDREQKDESWGLTDGSAGLRGQVIKTDDLTELKLFAASFLSAGATAFQDTQSTVYGTRPDASVKNAALSGVSSVLNSYAAQMLEAIRQDGMFARVPAGKQFYLYVTQTMDRQGAAVGNSRQSERVVRQSSAITQRPTQTPAGINVYDQ